MSRKFYTLLTFNIETLTIDIIVVKGNYKALKLYLKAHSKAKYYQYCVQIYIRLQINISKRFKGWGGGRGGLRGHVHFKKHAGSSMHIQQFFFLFSTSHGGNS